MKLWLSRYLSVLTLVTAAVLIIFITADVFRAYHASNNQTKPLLMSGSSLSPTSLCTNCKKNGVCLRGILVQR
jgi:hypothetical protein